MSFDLDVYVATVPRDLEAAWLRKLKHLGLHCEFHPSFRVSERVSASFVPIRAVAEERKIPFLGEYGARPWSSGFELEHADFDPGAEPIPCTSPEVEERIAKARHRFSLRTGRGRTVADVMVQCYAAAALVLATDGLLFDPQSGQCFPGRSAIAYAAREVEAFLKASGGRETWCLQPFVGWSEEVDGTLPDDAAAGVQPFLKELSKEALEDVATDVGFRYFSGNIEPVFNHPAIYAHGDGITVVGKGYFRLFSPAELEDALKEYRVLLKKCGYK